MPYIYMFMYSYIYMYIYIHIYIYIYIYITYVGKSEEDEITQMIQGIISKSNNEIKDANTGIYI
jgi:hypothetical protein